MTTHLILENADKLASISIAQLTGVQHPNYGRSSHPSFFLEWELTCTKEIAIQLGIYRHCKPYKGHFLDYIVRKEYATLEDWVTDCGAQMKQIRFGYQKFDDQQTHVSLEELIRHLEHRPPPILTEDPAIEELTKFVDKLHVDDLTLKDVLISTHTCGIIPYDEYMKE